MTADAIGVQAGMTVKQARAACPGLVIVARDEVAERDAMHELLDALETCSPLVDGAAPGICYFDAAALPAGEARALGASVGLAEALGFSGTAAIADDKFAARCAALVAGGGASIVPPAASASFLAPLPVSLLPLAPGDADRFELLGLRTLGQIAALPTAPLAARFGERARGYSRLARGRDDEPLHPRSVQTTFEDRFAFDEAVDRLEPLLFALKGCIANVTARLAGSAHVCDRIEVTLELDGNDPLATSIVVQLAEPSACAATIFDLARIALESRESIGLVGAIAVRVAPCGEPPPQMTLFDGTRASRRAALAATLARLHAALDRNEVVMVEPTLSRSRLPERMQRATPIESPNVVARSTSERSTYTDRLERSPKAVADADRRPWAPALRLVDPPKPIAAPPASAPCAGPFRLSESWWERPVERDYYQLADPRDGLLLVFRDLREGRWYVQGVFD